MLRSSDVGAVVVGAHTFARMALEKAAAVSSTPF